MGKSIDHKTCTFILFICNVVLSQQHLQGYQLALGNYSTELLLELSFGGGSLL